jgi:hypothetical protein
MFQTTPSDSGAFHRSRAEADAAERLAKVGIVPYDRPLPVRYRDHSGAEVNGRSDFADIDLGISYEWKARELNGVRTKATSDANMAAHAERVALGFVVPGSHVDDWHRVENQFSHSAWSIAGKQKAMHDAGHMHVLIFGRQPSKATLKRLRCRDILYFVEGSAEFKRFMTMCEVARVPGISLTTNVYTDFSTDSDHWEVRLS